MNNKQPVARLVFCCILIAKLTLPAGCFAEENEQPPLKLEEATVFDLPILSATQDSINEHFKTLGGFNQSRSSLNQPHFNKYYSPSQLADSYYLDFRFNKAGEVTSVTQLYRPYNRSIQQSVNGNSRALSTQDLARKLSKQYGNPTSMVRKGWGGFSQYIAYFWENDQIKIQIDRQGEESLGNVYVKFEIKQRARYLASSE